MKWCSQILCTYALMIIRLNFFIIPTWWNTNSSQVCLIIYIIIIQMLLYKCMFHINLKCGSTIFVYSFSLENFCNSICVFDPRTLHSYSTTHTTYFNVNPYKSIRTNRLFIFMTNLYKNVSLYLFSYWYCNQNGVFLNIRQLQSVKQY